MLHIGEHHVVAFESSVDASSRALFSQLWQKHRARLGVLRQGHLEAVIHEERVLARDVGVNDDQVDRLFLLAAAKRLMPKATPSQAILLLDVVFADEPVDSRMAGLERLRADGGD